MDRTTINQIEGEKWRMKRLGSKLNALSSATITATEKAQQQIDLVVNELLKGGVNND
ncbi:hypothetical protein [Limosilactobacillus reuteri]|uniref:hypothetical protein n=1 Tax=Limosilactobacillus reuteri TaxID=1598 RepID=UPI0013E92E0E|nr:hypothetical protein [Limosilactobacillus reuteri]